VRGIENEEPRRGLVGGTSAGFGPSGQQEGSHLTPPTSGGSRDSVKKDPATRADRRTAFEAIQLLHQHNTQHFFA
jgi:hypothetical protein